MIKTLVSVFTILLPMIAWADDTVDESKFDPSYAEFYGSFEIEGTFFPEDAAPAFDVKGGLADRGKQNLSIAYQPSLLMEWGDNTALTITSFVRWDQHDNRRTHFDLREAKLDLTLDDWDLTLGLDSVFWGKTEAVHLVDIINQDDNLEDIDGEDKLGQPMIRLSRSFDIGTFTGFYLPYFREREHLGAESRLRPAVNIETTGLIDDSREEWTPTFAARYDHTIQDADIGLSAFHGLSRDPAFMPTAFTLIGGIPTVTSVQPVYDVITQIGFDGQYISDATLWKLETIYRWGQRNNRFEEEDYFAITGGLEHSLYGIAETNADLGIIVEYAYDQRGDDTFDPFQNDLILGARLALNDTQDTSALITAAIDVDTQVTSIRLEAERRLFEGWKLNLEGGAFLNTAPNTSLYDLRDDAYLRAKLVFFW